MTPVHQRSTSPELRPFTWEACDGLASGEITSTPVDGHWPAMVELQLYGPACSFGFHMTVEDAKDLAASLGAAASWSELKNREARRGL